MSLSDPTYVHNGTMIKTVAADNYEAYMLAMLTEKDPIVQSILAQLKAVQEKLDLLEMLV